MVRVESAEYVDGVVEYHQFRAALDLSRSEAKHHQDTLEIFARLTEHVGTNPELIAAYTGVICSRGERKDNSVKELISIERSIAILGMDVDAFSDSEYSHHLRQLEDPEGIRQIARQFISLFKPVIPADMLPAPKKRKRAAKPKVASLEIVPDPEPEKSPLPIVGGKVLDLSIDLDSMDVVSKKDHGEVTDSPDEPVKASDRIFDYNNDGAESVDKLLNSLAQSERTLAEYIIFGTTDVEIRTDIRTLQKVMSVISGSKALKSDPLVVARFVKCNDFILQIVQPGETVQIKTDRNRNVRKLGFGPSFRHPGARCNRGNNTNDLDERLEWWYPERGQSTVLQKSTCFACPALDECLQFAITTTQKFGIWGGTSERQRRQYRNILDRSGYAAMRDKISKDRSKDAKRALSYAEKYLEQEDAEELETYLLQHLQPNDLDEYIAEQMAS